MFEKLKYILQWIETEIPEGKEEAATTFIMRTMGSKLYGDRIAEQFMDAIEAYNIGGTKGLKVELIDQNHSGSTWSMMAHGIADVLNININALWEV